MKEPNFQILPHVKVPIFHMGDYSIFLTEPCQGVCFVNPDSPHFIHGRMAVKGHKGGVYPDHYLDFIDRVFGPEPQTIEACSKTVKVDSRRTALTVDLDPKNEPSIVGDAQILAGVPSGQYKRWRCDPPYNADTAREMYNCELPQFNHLLEAGARVCQLGSFMFLLLGPQNYQVCPEGVMRVGLIYISVIPNNETRALNIYHKYAEPEGPTHYQGQLL